MRVRRRKARLLFEQVDGQDMAGAAGVKAVNQVIILVILRRAFQCLDVVEYPNVR